MKKIFLGIGAIVLLAIIIFGGIEKNENSNYFRLHIRANSNAQIDQEIKYEIKERVVSFLTPYLSKCETKEQSISLVQSKSEQLEDISNNILKNNNFNYVAKIKIEKQNFPEKAYGDFVLPAGVYDSIIIELGEAVGDNWWCVVYPPLCFLNGGGANNSVYKSRILEIIQKVIGGNYEN